MASGCLISDDMHTECKIIYIIFTLGTQWTQSIEKTVCKF